jgi:integron integrase
LRIARRAAKISAEFETTLAITFSTADLPFEECPMDMQEIWAQLRERSKHTSPPRSDLTAPPPTKTEFSPDPIIAAEPQAPKPKLLDQVRRTMRVAHYAIRTEQAYVDWIRRFILFHNKRHPNEMGAIEITEFLTDLAVAGKVAPSTQNQALSALLFLYQQVLKRELPRIDAVRASAPVRLPVVMSVSEVRRLFESVPEGLCQLMIELMYGSGLRLLECCRLRVKDVDFARRQIIVREGKGDKDRAVPLPELLTERLRQQIETVRRQHQLDIQAGSGRVWLPHALSKKYPQANRELIW